MSSQTVQAAGSYTDGSWHRLHPLTPVLRGGLAVVALMGVFFAIVWEMALESIAHYVVFRELPDNPTSDVKQIPFLDSLGGVLMLGLVVVVGGAGRMAYTALLPSDLRRTPPRAVRVYSERE